MYYITHVIPVIHMMTQGSENPADWWMDLWHTDWEWGIVPFTQYPRWEWSFTSKIIGTLYQIFRTGKVSWMGDEISSGWVRVSTQIFTCTWDTLQLVQEQEKISSKPADYRNNSASIWDPDNRGFSLLAYTWSLPSRASKILQKTENQLFSERIRWITR